MPSSEHLSHERVVVGNRRHIDSGERRARYPFLEIADTEEAPIQRFLSYTLSGDNRSFNGVCEKYLACHLEKELFTLTFYKSLI